MVALIIGSNPLLDAIKRYTSKWKPPFGGDEREQISMLAQVDPPNTRERYILTNVGGDWSRISAKGWRILWCDMTRPPVGTVSALSKYEQSTVRDLCYVFWRDEAPDMRRVVDLLTGNVRHEGVVLMVTGFTGGVGKTTTSWRLAQAAAEHGVSSLLVDANRDQSSVRSFFDAGERARVNTIADWRSGLSARQGANHGRSMFNVPFDLTFAPSAGQAASWDTYLDFIHQASMMWDFVVVDFDRVSVDTLRDPSMAGGGLLAPRLRAGTPTLFIVKAGLQTQGDAFRQLKMFDALGFPPDFCGFKDVMPAGMRESDYRKLNYKPFGSFLGVEQMSDRVAGEIARGNTEFKDAQLDDVRDAVLDWVLPDRGFAHEPTVVKRGLFGFARRK